MSWNSLNWDTIIHDALIALPATIVALAAFMQARKTHQVVNGRMTDLLALAIKYARADAVLEDRIKKEGEEDARKSQIT